MTTKQLRNKILDLAIHGRLVPQDPNDEPASVLLSRIHAEKKKLVDCGKLKEKDLATTPVNDEDKPFVVPEGWEWCRLGDLIQLINGDRGQNYPSKNKLSNTGNIPFVSALNIDNCTISEKNLLFLQQEQYDKLGSGKLLLNDIVLCIRGSLGKVCIYPYETGAIASSLVILRALSAANRNFILNYILSPFFYVQMDSYNNGTAQPNLSAGDLVKFLIPLPPLAEQERIVAAVEKWMSLIDVIESGQENLQQSIALAKNKILDLAIKGKLMEKEGEWEEKTGKEIFEPLKSTKPSGEYFNYIDIDAIDNKRCRVIEPKRVLVTKAPSRASRHTQKGDVLFSMVRPYLRNIALVEEDNCIASTGFYVCRSKLMTPKFCYYLMLSEYVVQGLNSFMKGDNSPSITNKNILDFKFPLPPLSEQRRIVAKVEELFAQLDSIAGALK